MLLVAQTSTLNLTSVCQNSPRGATGKWRGWWQCQSRPNFNFNLESDPGLLETHHVVPLVCGGRGGSGRVARARADSAVGVRVLGLGFGVQGSGFGALGFGG